MSKTITSEFQSHLAQETTSLATCWHLTRTDGTEFFFTDHDTEIVFESNTYIADSGYQRSAIQNDSSLSTDNVEVTGFLDSDQISDQDLRGGKFDYAEVEIFMVNWSDLTQESIKLRRGRLGEVSFSDQGEFRAELLGLTNALKQTIGNVTQPECRADLGDSKCTVPIAPDIRQDSASYALGTFIKVATTAGSGQAVYENRIYECTTAGTTAGSAPTYDTTVGNTTSDGTAVFTTRQAWTRHGVVDTVTDRTQFTLTVAFDESRAVDNWFNNGALEFESGDNDGRVIEIRDWTQSTRELTLFLPASFTIVPGVLVRLYPGCDKRRATCRSKFEISGSTYFDIGNVINFRGEPFIPGQDKLLEYPDAQ
jgi:uncharacterized phage protein (TIGR02218 family)